MPVKLSATRKLGLFRDALEWLLQRAGVCAVVDCIADDTTDDAVAYTVKDDGAFVCYLCLRLVRTEEDAISAGIHEAIEVILHETSDTVCEYAKENDDEEWFDLWETVKEHAVLALERAFVGLYGRTPQDRPNS